MARSAWGVLVVVSLVLLVLLVLVGERRQASERAENPLYLLTSPALDLTERDAALVAAGEHLRSSGDEEYARRLLRLISDLGIEQWSHLPPPVAEALLHWFAHYLKQAPIDIVAVTGLELLFAQDETHPAWPALWDQWQLRIDPLYRRLNTFATSFDYLLAEPANPYLAHDLAAMQQRWGQLVHSPAHYRGLRHDRYFHSLAGEIQESLANSWLLHSVLPAITVVESAELASLVAALSPAQRQALRLWTTVHLTLADGEAVGARLDAALRATQLAGKRSMLWWWLMTLSGLAAVLVAWLASSAGPPAVDPSAETLENVDPIDLDTDAGTMSDPGATTGDRTTVGEYSLTDNDR